ncbi:MAG: hypothetical protein IPM42_06325 [Saprospiraceae bacterium]|nr:hypothetical protein [Saprospiraceae bacterium]
MKYQDKKVAGVWIDHNEARIVTTSDHQPNGVFEVVGKVKSEHHTHKGSSENTFNNKQTQELNRFFKDLAVSIKSYDALYIIGPGQAQEQLKNFFKTDSNFKNKEVEIGTADTHQTHNQMIAQIRNHFQKE